MTYAFDVQLTVGERYERHLDEVFGRWYSIQKATMAEQRMGIDRIFTRLDTGETSTVEYKADRIAGSTGNAFVETLSVDRTGKPGWAVASRAMRLVYLVTEPETIYIIRMRRLREQLSRWQTQYGAATAANKGYHTHGLLVPLVEFEKIAEKVL